MECVNSGCSGALKSGKLGLNRKVNKYCGAGTGDLGVLTAHEMSSMETYYGDAGATHHKYM